MENASADVASKRRPYRSKTTPPCDACRKRRMACIRDEAEPSCSLCQHRHTTCTFNTVPRPRKRRPRESRTVARSSEPRNLDSFPTPATLDSTSGVDDEDPSLLSPSFHTANYATTNSVPGRTCLYSGSSSDQDPNLLRHLIFNDNGCFGDDRWTIWKVTSLPSDPVHFTVFMNHHLDCHAEMYANARIETFFSPYQEELINLYYEHVHPCYPVLSEKDDFLQARAVGRLPNSLLAAVYSHGAVFWKTSWTLNGRTCPDYAKLRPYIWSSLSLEARTPNLAVIQAALLFMQLPPQCIRAPNHPGFWSMTSMLVAMGQDIGLHRDPSSWNIPMGERKLRRMLWWAIYMHDKWMAHWLGRPSHINDNHYAVEPLTLDDFSNDDGMMSVASIPMAKNFIAMTELSTIISSILDNFHSARSQTANVDMLATAVSADNLQSRLRHWKEQNGLASLSLEKSSRAFTVLFAGYTAELSVYRAILGTAAAGFDGQVISQITNVLESLCLVMEDLQRHGKRDFWLSYNKGSLAVAGSLAVTLVLSCVDESLLQERRILLLKFRDLLAKLAGDEREFEFARLPLRRLNLIIEDVFGQNYGADIRAHPNEVYNNTDSCFITSPSVEAAVEEMIWANYTIPI